ncbi:hypothetical protein AWJ20_5213 [Sugiyamaella lignohabitans]|uniref:RRM domain-containing protein n=1 Tax=Sugiyamaella lignohabitans TaxID=796027 RepID=A0A167EMF5_9ASCO|nr:uncharacterized protein AWJ20_5213 [Sugiyamaella lignohabitans]ANB14252.1 hypothetical protein AWJ20_5213 [Sugiyamaella lignohabitans]
MSDDYEIDLDGGFTGGVDPSAKVKVDPPVTGSSTANPSTPSVSTNPSSFSNSRPTHIANTERRSPLPNNAINQGSYNNQSRGYVSSHPMDPTSAVIIYNLEWWTNEEEVRGWAVDAGVEANLKNVIFDEHKVNSKSKGTVYVEFNDVQATKLLYESFTNKQRELRNSEDKSNILLKLSIAYTIPSPIPFRTFNKGPQSRNQGPNGNVGMGGPNRNGMNRHGNAGNAGNTGPARQGQMAGYSGYQVQGGFNPMAQFSGGFPPFGFPPGGFYNQPPPQQWSDANNPHGSKRPRQ